MLNRACRYYTINYQNLKKKLKMLTHSFTFLFSSPNNPATCITVTPLTIDISAILYNIDLSLLKIIFTYVNVCIIDRRNIVTLNHCDYIHIISQIAYTMFII